MARTYGSAHYVVTDDGTSIEEDAKELNVISTGSTEARSLGDRFADVVNVKDFGAVGDGITDDSGFIQAAVDHSKSIFIPPGDYLLSKPIEISQSNSEIVGVKGESILRVDGSHSALTIINEFTAENVRVVSINFDTTSNGIGKGIYNVAPAVYLAHWVIRDCTFSTHLNYGIDANMIGCEVTSCMFGYHARGAVGMQAIRSRGSQNSPIRVSNINKFDSCEFARCDNMPYVVEFDIGIRVEFTNCVFEVNKPQYSVVRLNGVYKPVFQGCWFEVNDADSLVSLGLKDGIDALALSFTDGIINETGSTITAAFDFTDTQNKTLIFENTLISQGSFDLTKVDSGDVTVLSQKGNYSTNSQIDMGVYDKAFFGTGVKTTGIEGEDALFSGLFQVTAKSTSTTQYSRTYQIIGSNSFKTTTDLEIPYANTNAGGIAIIRGTLSNGRSFSTLYAVSIRVGSGNDVDAAEIGNSGVYAPSFTFANEGGFLTISNDDAAGTSYCTLIGF
ncbi:pectin lyase fold protein [Vibrio phage 2.275.O._10N.286.54.E11]|nr:pectin lyase fold protein [Vibrio phage 2.275.O._10N.286.54.E11]